MTSPSPGWTATTRSRSSAGRPRSHSPRDLSPPRKRSSAWRRTHPSRPWPPCLAARQVSCPRQPPPGTRAWNRRRPAPSRLARASSRPRRTPSSQTQAPLRSARARPGPAWSSTSRSHCSSSPSQHRDLRPRPDLPERQVPPAAAPLAAPRPSLLLTTDRRSQRCSISRHFPAPHRGASRGAAAVPAHTGNEEDRK